MRNPGGVMLRKPPHMHLIDDQVFHGNQGLSGIFPVEIVLHHSCPVNIPFHLRYAPQPLSRHCLGIDIQKCIILVEQKPFLRIIWPIHPVGILKVMYIQSEYDHGIYFPDLIILRKLQHGIGLRLHTLEQKQFAGRSAVRVHRKIHPAWNCGGPVHLIHAGPNLKSVNHIHRLHMNPADRRLK